jgi:hypothetical protein
VLDPRIYRAAFLPLLFALVLAAFSVRDQPRALTTTLSPTAFDGAAAFRQLQQLAALAPRRRPGSAGDGRVAAVVARELRSDGFRVELRHASGTTADGTRELTTVVGERDGASNRRIVVLAHRDALGHGAPAELSGTAALLELARVLGGRTLNRTLVLVSTSGGSAGAAAAAQFARDPGGPVDAVLALGDVAGRGVVRPVVVPWADTSAIAPLALRRTLEAAVLADVSTRPGGTSPAVQFVRLAFPYALGEQAPFAAHGIPAAGLSASGERPPVADAPVSSARLTAFGRAALRSVSALDAGPDVAPPAPYVVLARKVLPAWPVRVLGAAFLLPVLLAAIDAFARVRRRRERVGMWLRWVAASALPFLFAALFAIGLHAVGLLAAAPAASPAGAVAVDGWALVGVLAVFAVGWVGLRPALLRLLDVRGTVASAGAATATVLVLCAAALAVWVANPYAALLLVPALHLWLLAVAPEVPLPRAGALVLVVLGLLPPLFVAVVEARQLGLDPLELAWAGVLLVAGGGVGLLAVVVWCAVLGCGAATLAIVLRGLPDSGPDAPAITVGQGRSAAPRRRCDDERRPLQGRTQYWSDATRPARLLDRLDRRRRADDRRRRRDARLAGADLRADRAHPPERAVRPARPDRARRADARATARAPCAALRASAGRVPRARRAPRGAPRRADRADRHSLDRRALRRRAGDGWGEPAQGPRALPRDRVSRSPRDGRDRRPPHDLPRALPRRRRAQARPADRARDAVRALLLRGPAGAHRLSRRALDHAQRRL